MMRGRTSRGSGKGGRVSDSKREGGREGGRASIRFFL